MTHAQALLLDVGVVLFKSAWEIADDYERLRGLPAGTVVGPLGTLVGLQPLPLAYFPWLAGTLLSYCCVAQLMKTIYIRRFKQWY